MPTVLFGISGSIAAFKALEVIRLLVADGVEVYPVISEGGSKFVTRPSVEALTGQRAVTEIFPEPAQQEIEHIALARKADLLVTCPASADIIAKYACGIADDPLALVALAFGMPHLIAPAMNHRMWDHPATRANVELLKERGCVFVGPDKGMMACGEEGWGRLAQIEDIYGHICAQLGRDGPLAGRKILVSAGATREFIDDIRFISNRSTGKMGYALAEAARDMGGSVVLVTASDLRPPSAVRVERVTSAAEMRDIVVAEAQYVDAVVMAAAVSDFQPSERVTGKIKKEKKSTTMELGLTRTPDILAELGGVKKSGQVFVGFAAEFGPDGKSEAVRKCKAKGCEFVCLNDVSRDDIGFGTDENELVMIFPDGSEKPVPRGPKKEVARAAMAEIVRLFGSYEELFDTESRV